MLEVVNLVKRYPNGTEALKGLSFAVGSGEIFGVLGPNGAGKTTLLKLVLGVLLPTSGFVSLEGVRPDQSPAAFRRMVGVVHQYGAFDMALSVVDNLSIFGAFQGLGKAETRARTAYLLDRFELSAKAKEPVQNLSGGQRRKVQLARALLHRPRFLFLDEPTAGLDPFSRRMAWSIIMEEREPSSYVLCTSHYVDEIERNCDRVMIMDQGTEVALGTPKNLVDSISGHRVEFNLDRCPPDALIAAVEGLSGVSSIEVSESTLKLRVADAEWAIAKVTECCFSQGIRVNSVVTKRASLEDVLLQATGRELS